MSLIKSFYILYLRNNLSIFIIPIVLFFIEWVGIGLLYSSFMFPIREARFESIFIIYSGVTAIILGYFFYIIFQQTPNLNIEKKTCSIIDIYSFKRMDQFNIAIVLFCLAGAYLSISEIGRMAGDPLIFFSNPLKVRMIVTSIDNDIKYQSTILYKLGSYLINFGIIGTFISAYLLKSKKFYLSSLSPFFIGLLSSLVFFSRYMFITYVLFFLISAFLISKSSSGESSNLVGIRFKIVVFSSLLLITSVFFLILFARNFYIEKIGELALKQIYYYFSGGISSFDAYLVHVHQEYTYGLSMTKGLSKWLISLGLANTSMVNSTGSEFIKVAPNVILNTYTFAKAIYSDFGLAGVVIISFFWGYTAAFSIKKFVQKFTWVRLYWAVILIFSLIMSFFGFYFENISLLIFRIILVYIFSLLINFYCIENKKSTTSSSN